jgi:hypothetical protein
MVWRKGDQRTHYGSVRPTIDFPMFADLDLEKKIDPDDLICRI